MPDASTSTPQGSPLGPVGDERSTSRAVRTMFERVAPRYDFLNHLLSFGRDIAWRRKTARSLRTWLERPGTVSADVCCGTGDLALALSRFSAGPVIGADFCHPMLRLAREKAARTPSSPRFIGADTLALPFRDGSIDVISAAFGFRNLANYTRGLEEMFRVLKPQGVAAILEFSRVDVPVLGPLFRFYFRKILPRIGTVISGVAGPYQYLPDSVALFPNQEKLASMMREAGFSNVRYQNFFLGAAALHLGEK